MMVLFPIVLAGAVPWGLGWRDEAGQISYGVVGRRVYGDGGRAGERDGRRHRGESVQGGDSGERVLLSAGAQDGGGGVITQRVLYCLYRRGKYV